jgi:large subunit ribosomal protein L22
MSKTAVNKIREFRAEAKFQRSSPQKAKLVLDTIKGMRVEQALNTVHFSTKRMGPVVEKVLRSAIQNATHVSQEQGLDIDVDNLYIRTAVANDGPRMKRIRPAPMGRAFRYQRRLTHIIVTVAEKKSSTPVATVAAEAPAVKETPVKPVAKKDTVKKAPAKKAPAKKTAAKKTAARKTTAKKATK